MSATATLPRASGNGAALVVALADLMIDFFSMSASKPAAKAAVSEAVVMNAATEVSVWKLYRMTTGDSVAPAVTAELDKALVG